MVDGEGWEHLVSIAAVRELDVTDVVGLFYVGLVEFTAPRRRRTGARGEQQSLSAGVRARFDENRSHPGGL